MTTRASNPRDDRPGLDRPSQSRRGPFWMWLAICAVMVAAMEYLRFAVYPDVLVPLTYGLPLLVCVYNRDVRLLWGMAVVFLGMATAKLGLMLGEEIPDGTTRLAFLGMQVANIVIPATVIHGVIALSGRLERTIGALEESNAELEASNEELAAREEEISQQNEELQTQTEELEQQMEELNAQADELQSLNELLAARENTLNELLETIRVEGGERDVLARIGEMIPRLLGPRVAAAALMETDGDAMIVRPLLGLPEREGEPERVRRERTMSSLVMTRDQAGFLADLSLRPDLATPRTEGDGGFRSVLAAPLRVADAPAGALEVYSTEPGAWNETELRLAQWLAEQCARMWSGVRLREELEARRHELERQHQLVKAITDNATAALFMMDERGYCTYMNPAAERMTGFAFEEIRASPLHDMIHHHRPDGRPYPKEECPLDRALPDEASVAAHEDVFFRKDGTPFPVMCSARPIYRGGRPVSTVIEVRDMTEQRRYEEEREMLLESERAARAEAERASRAKDEFVATLSHELRTPLNAILGWASLLRRCTDNPGELANGLDVIERNTRLQAQLISDLLDVTRINTGKIRLDVQAVDLPRVIENAIETVRPAADAKGVRLEKLIEPVDRMVMGDPGRLQQVVWNLLSNAIKFTPRGGSARVVLSRVASYVQIVVSDTGQGIDPDFLPQVFRRYRQADSSATRKHGGLGLGLSIVKNLVELHGGSVEVRSEGLGKGATFIVLLPVRAVASEAGAAMPHPAGESGPMDSSGGPPLDGIAALVVDDEGDARELVRRVLEERGARVITAESGDEALERLESGLPDVLISDIGMPGMDGYTLIRRVRAERAANARDLPAIALTAFARSEDRTRALLAGFQSHIAKPVEPSELVAAVSSLCAGGRRADGRARGGLDGATDGAAEGAAEAGSDGRFGRGGWDGRDGQGKRT